MNVNAPDLPAWKIKGTKIVKCGPKRFKDSLIPVEEEESLYRYAGGHYELPEEEPEDEDVAACADGYATITPLRMDYTDGAALRTMQRMTNDNACVCLSISRSGWFRPCESPKT